MFTSKSSFAPKASEAHFSNIVWKHQPNSICIVQKHSTKQSWTKLYILLYIKHLHWSFLLVLRITSSPSNTNFYFPLILDNWVPIPAQSSNISTTSRHCCWSICVDRWNCRSFLVFLAFSYFLSVVSSRLLRLFRPEYFSLPFRFIFQVSNKKRNWNFPLFFHSSCNLCIFIYLLLVLVKREQ